MAVLLAALLAACGSEPQLLELSGPTMGTRYNVKLLAREPLASDEAERDIAGLLERLEQAMSTWREDSEISRFNRYQGDDWFAVSPDFAHVLAAAIEVSELSGGAFDVTVAPLVDLWGFDARQTAGLPSDEQIAAAAERVGYRKLEVREAPAAVRKAVPGVWVNLSAIAKGFAVDKLAGYLETRGVRDYLVEIGGEVRTLGVNERKSAWRIGIERPISGERSVQRVITPRDRGVATSGDYRNFFVHEGVRYSHTLNPRTGRPVTHDLASVTVLDETAMRADALATALLVLGPEQGFALATRLGLPAYFVVRDAQGFSERYTAAFADFLADEGIS